MNERGKSDNLVVPAKPPNNAGELVAEVVEGRRLAEGNTDSSTRPGRSAGHGVPSGLDRVREVARRDKDARFTALLHHVDLARLWAAYVAINPKAAPGADQVTWDAYGQDLRENLEDLLRRVHSGAYRASPSRRVYIPKPDGRQRPLGIATLEDKILQRAVVEVLNSVYEEDFLGFSYGFRPGRGPHDALDALAVGIGCLFLEAMICRFCRSDCCRVGSVCAIGVHPALLMVVFAGQRPCRWLSGDVPGAVRDCRFRGLRGRFRDDGRKSLTAGSGGARWRQG